MATIGPFFRLPYYFIKLAGRAFVGVPLTQAEDAATESSGAPCRYVLHEMKAITPVELFRKKLINKHYDDALTVAETYGLNSDPVYQEQWLKNDMTPQAIDNFLVKVKATSWVLNECLNQVPPSVETCRRLLNVGLSATANLETVDTEDLPSKSALCSIRYKLVRYRSSLDDYIAMLGGSEAAARFDAEYYKQIRKLSLYEWVLSLIRVADFSRLQVLLNRYGKRLFNVWLPLLGNIVETVDVNEYEFFLPLAAHLPEWHQSQQSEAKDFIDDQRFAAVLERQLDNIEVVVGDKPALRKYCFLNERSTDISSLLQDWYEYRALEIERLSGLPDLAEKFLTAAVANGFKALQHVLEDMALLRMLNYECHLSRPLSYERLRKTQPSDILKMLLNEAPKESFIHRVTQWAIPFCERSEQQSRCSAKKLIWNYVKSASEESLKTALLVFENLKTNKEFWSKRLAWTLNDTVHLATDCLMSCDDASQIDATFQLVAYIPDVEESSELSSLVNEFENHVAALHLLSVYGIMLSYKKLQQISGSSQESILLLKRLVRYGISSQGTRSWTIDDWRTLLRDMLRLSRTILPSIDNHNCKRYFVEGLLSSGSSSLIDLASAFFLTERPKETRLSALDGKKRSESDAAKSEEDDDDDLDRKLSYDEGVELIYVAAEAYMLEAVDWHDDCLNLARKCLSLMENPSEKLRREMNFIDALPILDFFELREVPAKLRMYKNRTRIIEEILTKRTDAYKDYERLSKLCDLLGVPVVDRSSKECLLILCGENALFVQDFDSGVRFCKEILQQDCASGWHTCWRVCESFQSLNDELRTQFLCFCLKYCDESQLESILQRSRDAKIAMLAKDLQFDFGRTFGEQAFWKNAVSAPLVAPVSWKLDQANLKIKDYQPAHESIPFNERTVGLLNGIRLALLTGKSEPRFFDDLLAVCGISLLNSNTTLGVAMLLAIKEDDIIDQRLSAMAVNSLTAEIALYCSILRSAVKSKIPPEQLQQLLRSSPKSLISAFSTRSDKYVNRWATKMNNFWQQNTLLQLPEGVDRFRFEQDAQYRRDTIVGVALSADEKAYAQALNLAEFYNVPVLDIHLAHMEYLFVESNMNATQLNESIKKDRLIEKLSENPTESERRMMENIFPLLNGRDHTLLSFFYAVVAKFSSVANPVAAQHRAVLKQWTQLAPDIDYKKLITDDEMALDIMMPYLNAENFTAFAKLATKIPNKQVSLEDVLGVWAKKVFVETNQKAKVDVAFNRCLKIFEKLNTNVFLRVVRHLLFAPKFVDKLPSTAARLTFIRLCLEFVQQRDKYSSAKEQLLSYQKFLHNCEAMDKKQIMDESLSVTLLLTGGEKTQIERFAADVILAKQSFDLLQCLTDCIENLDENEIIKSVLNRLLTVDNSSQQSTTVAIKRLTDLRAKAGSRLAFIDEQLQILCKSKQLSPGVKVAVKKLLRNDTRSSVERKRSPEKSQVDANEPQQNERISEQISKAITGDDFITIAESLLDYNGTDKKNILLATIERMFQINSVSVLPIFLDTVIINAEESKAISDVLRAKSKFTEAILVALRFEFPDSRLFAAELINKENISDKVGVIVQVLISDLGEGNFHRPVTGSAELYDLLVRTRVSPLIHNSECFKHMVEHFLVQEQIDMVEGVADCLIEAELNYDAGAILLAAEGVHPMLANRDAALAVVQSRKQRRQ